MNLSEGFSAQPSVAGLELGVCLYYALPVKFDVLGAL